jgi:hypothetical protein
VPVVAIAGWASEGLSHFTRTSRVSVSVLLQQFEEHLNALRQYENETDK